MGFLPNSESERAEMLRSLGMAGFEQLLGDMPETVRLKRDLHLPEPISEFEAKKHLAALSSQNASSGQWACFAGAGAYDHFVPSVVDRMASREEFYTAYTPYQPEISQGTLQSIYEFQSLLTRLTGMEVANASLYDGGTALAEAVLMANAINGRKGVVLSGCANPLRLAVLRTYLRASGFKTSVTDWKKGRTCADEIGALVGDDTTCVILENPNFFGVVESPHEIGEIARSHGALFVVSVDPISLGILAAPTQYGADIVVGEGQSLGNRLSFGGPYLGFMATKREFIRRLPGRIVGKTVDRNGKACFCLTLQTREQHIRREKATSNICTNQALVALRAAIYLSWLGKEGLREVATLCLSKAVYAHRAMMDCGIKPRFDGAFFKEFVIDLPVPADRAIGSLIEQRIVAGVALARFYPGADNSLLVSFTEKRTKSEIDRLIDGLRKLLERRWLDHEQRDHDIPEEPARTERFLASGM